MSESEDLVLQGENMLARRVKLANGLSMPQIQIGLYRMQNKEAFRTVGWALGAGYRGFDSAQWYGNERSTGRSINKFLAWRASDDARALGHAPVTREDIHYTTKLKQTSSSHDPAAVREAIRESVDKSGLAYVDLFLVHSPYGGKEVRMTGWRALEDAVLEGKVRMIGVSNYGVAHIEELMASNPRIRPVVNQIEVHPFNTQTAIREACARHGIVVQAYAPLAAGMRFDHPVITALATKYGCSPAQLMIRWSIQHGFVTLPKSEKQARIIENANVGWFALSDEDMQLLDGLDQKLVTDWDPTGAP